MKVKAHAKLNFYLEILGKREDGYHELRSIMQQVRLHDVLVFKKSSKDKFTTRDGIMKESDLVVRATKLLRKRLAFPFIHIELRKQIPIGAGLGGGSSDAAATLVGLKRFFSLDILNSELKDIAAELGSDVPFFIDTLAAKVEGTGTLITGINPINVPHILLVRPKGKLSTADVYGALRPEDYSSVGNFESFTQSWNHGILGTCFNHLERPAFRLDSRVKLLKQSMIGTKPIDCLMTGSGNVVFGIYASKEDLEKARHKLAPIARWTRATSTIKDNYE